MNKRLIILFICIAIVVVTVIVGAVTFTVRSVEILAPLESEDAIDKTKIVIDSKIKIGGSIFSLSEEKVTDNIERSNPYIKVVTIERVFPSAIHINVALRAPIIALPLDDGVNSVLVDRELKLLEIIPTVNVDVANIAVVSGFKLIGVTSENVGQSLKLEGNMKFLSEAIMACENVGLVNEFVKVFVKEFNFSHENYIVLATRKGLNIAIRTNSNIDIKSQMHSLFSVFESSQYKEDSSRYIFITDNGIVTSTVPPSA